MSLPLRVLAARRLRFLPRRAYLIAHHALFQGELTTLHRPRTYAQLLARKNLDEQDPLVHRTADKYAVRAHVAERVGEQYLVPLLQVVDSAADLDLGSFDEPYVIKGTHGCDMTILVRDPARADHASIRATVARWLDTDFYAHGWREAPYRGLPRRAVVERFLGAGPEPPADYKFFTFGGEPGMVVVDRDRFTGISSTLLHPDWREYAVSRSYGREGGLPRRPACYEEMLHVARTLGADFAFARIDLYDVDGRVFFGEITDNPGGGVVRLRPRAFDLALGELWRHGTPVPERFVRRPVG